ncbi:MAG TPA: sodium:calcium antiporter [Alphaproteobacteria bacterium]|nr:sodium:calcium antiporter [Alphaproteobacteria bacterium]
MTLGAGFLLAGLVLAGLGGELFVRGLVGIARWARIAPGIVGLTLAAFATSSPELSVSVNAALEGRPLIGLGNAIGGNVVNLGLVFGITLSLAKVTAPRSHLRRDFPVAFLIPLLTTLLIVDGMLSRLDGLLMLGLFLTWLAFTLVDAWKQRSAVTKVLGERRGALIILSALAGLGMLIIAGRLLVFGGTSLGQALGLNLFIVGATIVALGTSIPELATALVSRFHGHTDVGLGTLFGSNIFNGLFIIGLIAIIQPIELRLPEVVVGLGFGALVIAASFPVRGAIQRPRSVLLLALYAAYLVVLLQFGTWE